MKRIMEKTMAKRGPKAKLNREPLQSSSLPAQPRTESTRTSAPIAKESKPKIVPSEHAAMCGQATVDNHEERIRDLEDAVAYLLAQ